MCSQKAIIIGMSEILYGVWVWGREGEGRGGADTEYLVAPVCKGRKEVSSRLLWARVKRERESFLLISAYGPGIEKKE